MSGKKALSIQAVLSIVLLLIFCAVHCSAITASAQENDLEFALDVAGATVPLPNIFKPNIDLSGRGFHRDATWPQSLAAKEALDIWRKDIGFSGIYRLQYNLWEIQQFPKNRNLRNALLRNYENVISQISNSGGTVILNIFGTPAGLGRVLDKRSFPVKLKEFKSLVKERIRNLSCLKRYNIWYEVWSAPDLDDFYLGRRQEYLIMYRQIAEAVKELEAEYKVHIPIGAPGISWWFQNLENNTIATPENSLIYDLIRYCYRNRLPLDFITWHGFSSDPRAENQMTIYNAPSVKLIREWLSYFSFDKNTSLIVDEWNYDRGVNLAAGRAEDGFVCASYIPARLKGMYQAGLDYQLYFSLEDFQNNKEGVARNTGIFSYDPEYYGYKGERKSAYNIFMMLSRLGKNMYINTDKSQDEFVGVIATKDKDFVALIIYNYIDADIAVNYLTRVIGSLGGTQRKELLNLVKSDRLNKFLLGELEINGLRVSGKTRNILKKTKELGDKAKAFTNTARNVKIRLNNLKNNYLYQRYAAEALCVKECSFVAVEEKEISQGQYAQQLSLNPYSVQLIILKEKPRELEIMQPQQGPASGSSAAVLPEAVTEKNGS